MVWEVHLFILRSKLRILIVAGIEVQKDVAKQRRSIACIPMDERVSGHGVAIQRSFEKLASVAVCAALIGYFTVPRL